MNVHSVDKKLEDFEENSLVLTKKKHFFAKKCIFFMNFSLNSTFGVAVGGSNMPGRLQIIFQNVLVFHFVSFWKIFGQ